MATPSEISATSPEFSDEAIIAGELVARGRGGARWIAGLLAGTGGAGLILPGAVAWLYLSVPMTADIAIDRQQ